MICEHIELSMRTTKTRDVAKAMLKFWIYQRERARSAYISSDNRADSMKRANQGAAAEWKSNSDDFVGFGGPPKPYSDSEIATAETQAPIDKKHYQEADAMYRYMLDFITNKAHPVETN